MDQQIVPHHVVLTFSRTSYTLLTLTMTVNISTSVEQKNYTTNKAASK